MTGDPFGAYEGRVVANSTDLSMQVDALRGCAPRQTPTVRVLAAFSRHTTCGLAAAGFAAGVDFDRLLAGTEVAMDYGQSPFAFARGKTFEALLARDEYERRVRPAP